MIIKTSPKITTPTDNTVIWRYFTLDKFVDLVNTSKLYFRRLDLLPDDPFEGRLPKGSEKVTQDLLNKIIKALATMGTDIVANYQNIRNKLYINCWQNSDSENALMWYSYVGNKSEGIAIRTTVGLLKESFNLLDIEVYLGYIEYSENPLTATNLITPAFRKRKVFNGEHEVRMMVFGFDKSKNYSATEMNNMNLPDGLRFDINLETLICNIILSPGSDKMYKDKIDNLLLNKGIKLSSKFSIIDKPINF